MAPKKRTRRGFTLIELLTVMVMLVILTALVTPAVTSLSRSNSLVMAGNQLTNLATLAQQNAISKNTLTALVMLADQGTENDFRAFTVLQYTSGQGWSPISRWEIMPVGIMVDRSAASTFLAHSPKPFPFLSAAGVQANPPVFYQQAQVKNPEGYAARIFVPTGGLLNPEQPAQIRLVEGFQTRGRMTYTRPGKLSSTGAGREPANYYDLTILGATGVGKVSRPQ